MPSPPISVPSLTNPLTLYRSLLTTRQIKPDPSQHRLAIHLEKIYFRLLDYSPHVDYGRRLKALSRVVDNPIRPNENKQAAAPGHSLRRNLLFVHFFAKKEERDTLALTRVLTNYEEAISLKSPKGLLIHGEVGSGKSMLVDLLANGLPNQKKKRWHFNTFMLETIAKLEQLRLSRSTEPNAEHSLLSLAKDMIDKSPILFLDEFQLPDRASNKILSNLLTAFFQLGGVLIATSNRMPDELSKASGVDFTTRSKEGFTRKFTLNSKLKISGTPSDNEYHPFVEVLKARCEVWNMDGSRDWRRGDVGDEELLKLVEAGGGSTTNSITIPQGIFENRYDMSQGKKDSKVAKSAPSYYLLDVPDNEKLWQSTVRAATRSASALIPWQSTSLQVYGRKLPVLRHLNGVTYWSFVSLCGGVYGPADYITLTSTFHTLILSDVPVLTLSQRNEARRFITLLDALYEARCKLIIHAEVGPDDLFFPETKADTGDDYQKLENNGKDALHPETLSEICQDQTSPFRPNISPYIYAPKSNENSSFGSIPGNGREVEREVDFEMTSAFVGEDEVFAYRRAASRIWEMCGLKWHLRSEPGWWRPLPAEIRRWERSNLSNQATPKSRSENNTHAGLGDSIKLNRQIGLQGRIPEEIETLSGIRKEIRASPAKIGWTHAWGMVKWGKNAGAWGEGPEGLVKRRAKKKD